MNYAKKQSTTKWINTAKVKVRNDGKGLVVTWSDFQNEYAISLNANYLKALMKALEEKSSEQITKE